MKKFRPLTIICLILFYGCGYRWPEGDKHPDVPLFPKHTNPKFKVTEFPFQNYRVRKSGGFSRPTDFFGYTDNYFYSVCETNVPTDENNYTTSHALMIYDKQFRELKQIMVDDAVADTQGVLYFSTSDGVYKCRYPDFAPEKLPEVLSTDASIRENLQCVANLYGKMLLRYPDKECFLSNNQLLRSGSPVKLCEELQPSVSIDSTAANLEIFDMATTGNESSAGKSLFGFRPVGLEYFNFRMGGDVTSFKVNGSLSGQSVKQIKSPFADKLMLTTGAKVYFIEKIE